MHKISRKKKIEVSSHLSFGDIACAGILGPSARQYLLHVPAGNFLRDPTIMLTAMDNSIVAAAAVTRYYLASGNVLNKYCSQDRTDSDFFLAWHE